MSAVLVMMVPIDAIEGGASFAAAFAYVNLQWARYIVALGTCLPLIDASIGAKHCAQFCCSNRCSTEVV